MGYDRTSGSERLARRLRRPGPLGSLAIAILLVTGCGSSGEPAAPTVAAEGDEADPTPSPSPTSETAADPSPEPTSEPTPPPVALDPDAEVLDARQGHVAPGSYRVDTLGTPFTLTLGEGWVIQRNVDGRLVLTDPRTRAPGDNDLVFVRASRLIDPSNPRAPVAERGEGWPADDIEGWVANVIPDIDVTDVEQQMIGGTAAVVFDATVDDALGCSTGACIEFATNGETDAFLGPDSDYRVWWIDQGGADPIIIVAAARRSRAEFLANVEAVVASLAIGEALPNPVTS